MLTHTYLVDTGMPQDIALMAQASELSFFLRKRMPFGRRHHLDIIVIIM